MSSLISEHEEARIWVTEQKEAFAHRDAFAKLISAVIWTDNPGEHGEPLVPAKPRALIEEINRTGMPLLRDHDPGAPAGRFLQAKAFNTSEGRTFVAAILGYYTDAVRVTFGQLGIDADAAASPPALLPSPPDYVIEIATDPREVDPKWLDHSLGDAPQEVVRHQLSHNAADVAQELIRIGLPYILLVWNPFVTSVASEAGKQTYAALHQWLRRFFERLAGRLKPIVSLQSIQRECEVSFLFRGNDVKRNYAAHGQLSVAAAQAAQLIDHMGTRGAAPRALIYEFDVEADRWYPSFAELHDGTIVSDRNVLIAIEQLPSQLSLGVIQDHS